MVKTVFIICTYFGLVLIFINAVKSADWQPDEDAVIITASVENGKILDGYSSRQRRQFSITPYNYESSATSPCYTRSGNLGRCLTFDQCFPSLKLTSPAVYYETLITKTQDTCFLTTPSDKQDVGVCCSDVKYVSSATNQFPVFPSYSTNIDGTVPILSAFGNWPPYLPQPPSFQPPEVDVKWPPTLPVPPPEIPVSSWFPSSDSVRPNKSNDTVSDSSEEVSSEKEECGIKNGKQDQERIVGGHDADPGEWPWMAALMTNGRLFCGGSIIDDTHVLTAAHCVAHMNSWDVAKLRVHLGDYNIKSKNEVKHIERKVKKVIRHRSYDSETLYNDIALLKLQSPVPFSKNIRPICLAEGRVKFSGKMATVIGWGTLKENGPTPGILQEVNIPVWSNRECRSKYGTAAPGGIVDTFICAGKSSKDSCNGDSGGPLMVSEGKKWQQVGIVSWGIGCGKGQYPGVYTRITSFIPWIKKNLNT